MSKVYNVVVKFFGVNLDVFFLMELLEGDRGGGAEIGNSVGLL